MDSFRWTKNSKFLTSSDESSCELLRFGRGKIIFLPRFILKRSAKGKCCSWVKNERIFLFEDFYKYFFTIGVPVFHVLLDSSHFDT